MLQPTRSNYLTAETPDHRMPTLQNHSSAFSVFLSPLLVSLCDTAFTFPTAAFMSSDVQVFLQTQTMHTAQEATNYLTGLLHVQHGFGSINRMCGHSSAPTWILCMEPMIISSLPSSQPPALFSVTGSIPPGFIFTKNSS